MAVVPTLEPAPGKPRDVGRGRYFVDHPDGTVSLVVQRRAEAGAPSGLTLAFRAENDEAAEQAYGDYTSEQHVRVNRNAERRSNWGPLGTGKVR